MITLWCVTAGVPNPQIVAYYWTVAYSKPGLLRGGLVYVDRHASPLLTLVELHVRVHQPAAHIARIPSFLPTSLPSRKGWDCCAMVWYGIRLL